MTKAVRAESHSAVRSLSMLIWPGKIVEKVDSALSRRIYYRKWPYNNSSAGGCPSLLFALLLTLKNTYKAVSDNKLEKAAVTQIEKGVRVSMRLRLRRFYN